MELPCQIFHVELIDVGVMKGWLIVFIFMVWVLTSRGTELTFELPDRDKQCFYQEVEKGTECSLEYQVCIFSHALFKV